MDKRVPSLTVRIKLVDLNYYSGSAVEKSATRGSASHVSALIGTISERNQCSQETETKSPKADYAHGEICLRTGQWIANLDFETHIESCAICANRVELQLDFMDTLEMAIYQRQVEPNSAKVHGALLVSSPEMNFAICGELEV